MKNETRFEWDPAKERANRVKHGLSFRDASELFSSGVDCLDIYDEGHSFNEDRPTSGNDSRHMGETDMAKETPTKWTGTHSIPWRKTFIRTFLERDIPALGITIPPQTIRRFWQMLVHFHGQTFNASEIGSSMDVSDTTASRYLDILAGTFMVRRLQPWFENVGKRQVKRPKIYFRNSGILHALLGSTTREELLVHPKLGSSWEGFALEEMIRLNGADEDEVYFWAVTSKRDSTY